MAIILAILVFLTIAVVVFAFGAATVAPSSVLGSRLREIGWHRPKAEQKQPMRARFQQALDPLSRALPASPHDVSRTRAWLIQAGHRDPQHLSIYNGLRVLFAVLGLLGVFLFSGFDSPLLMLGMFAFGFFIPRFLLKRKVAQRQLRIRLGLPDALDLTVICVEAGLPLDQAMTRVGADRATPIPISATNSISSTSKPAPASRASKRSAILPPAPESKMFAPWSARSFKPIASVPALPRLSAFTLTPCAPNAASAPKSRPRKPP